MKNIVLYSDENFFDLSINTIESFRRVGKDFRFYYFQIGFEKPFFIYDMDIVTISIMDIPEVHSMLLIKPFVIEYAMTLVDDFIYVDVDLIASKHFDYYRLVNQITDTPFGCQLHDTEWQHPVFWFVENEIREEYDEKNLMDYLGVQKRTQPWVTTLMLAVNKNCKEFVSKWKKLCLDEYLMNSPNSGYRYKKFLHMGDETAYNVLLWKHNKQNYFDKHLIVEPKEIETIYQIENKLIEDFQLESNNPITYVKNSEDVFVFHQLKNLDFRIETLKKLYNAQHN